MLGPVTDREGAGKLSGGTIRKNHVHIKDGYEGIHVRKCDDFTVSNNVISGEAYCGIRISGRSRTRQSDLRAINNTVKVNSNETIIDQGEDNTVQLASFTVHVCEAIEQNHSDLIIVFSGNKGFHIHVLDFCHGRLLCRNGRHPLARRVAHLNHRSF